MSSGEAVKTLKHIGVGLRFVSILIDLILLLTFTHYFIYYMGVLTPDLLLSNYGPLFILLAVWFLYYWLCEAYLGGTPGKLILGIRVRMVDGGRIGLLASLIRNLLRIIDGLFFYLVGAFWVWFTPARQRLGDQIAGTVVVKAKKLPE